MRKKFLIYYFLLLLLFLVFAAAASYGGQATLCWDPPTTNADGTPLTDLGGYNIYYGTSSGNYTMTENMYLGGCVPCGGSHPECDLCANACTYTVTNLSEGTTFYFAATAYDTSNNESEYSNEVSITIQTTTLTVSKIGTGSGTVTSSPAGISCGSTCAANFNAGTVITLTAAATSGSTFTGWTDGSTYKGSGIYSFSLNASKTVVANFITNTSLRYLLWAKSGIARLWFLDSSDNYLGFKDYPLGAEVPIGFSMDSGGGTLVTYISSTTTTRLRQLDTNYNLTGYYKDYISNWIGKGHALNKLLWHYTATNVSRLWTSMDTNYNWTGYKDYTLSRLPVSYCNTGGGTGAIVISDNTLQHLDASGNLTNSTSWTTTSWTLKNCATSRLLWYNPTTYLTRIWTTNASDGWTSYKDYPASSGSWVPVQYVIFGQ